jgi:hypothetical protein
VFNLFAKPKDHLVLVALGKSRPSGSDFTDQYCHRSLIHLAALFNNLPLFMECLTKNDLNWQVRDFWGDNTLDYALQGQALDVLQYLVDRFQADVKVADKYGQPKWWSGFSGQIKMSEYSHKLFGEKDYLNYIRFLSTQGVDFNQRETGPLGCNLGSNLLSGYKFKTLYYFLRHTTFDVNQACRLDSGNSLGHNCAYMEDDRFWAMVRAEYKFLIPVYEMIFTQSHLSTVNKNGETILDVLVKSSYQQILSMFLTIKNLTMTPTQYLISNRYKLSQWVQDPGFCQTYGQQLFLKVEEIAPQLYSVNNKEVLIQGYHPEINTQRVKSVAELQKSQKIEAPNLYRSL